MESIDELLDLIGMIYDASYQREKWPVVLQRIAEVTRSSSSALIYRDSAYPKASFIYAHGIPDNALKMYIDEYIHKDPYFDLIVKRFPRGTVAADDRLLPSRKELRDVAPEYYDVITIPFDLYHVGAAGLFVDEDRMAGIAIQRRQALGPWSDEELAILQRLTPHIQRAFRIHREFTRFGIQEYVLHATLDQLVLGLVLLDRTGEIVYGNPAAEKILEKYPGIEKCNNRLMISDRKTSQKMHDAINLTLNFHPGEAPASTVIALRGNERCYPLLILITPASDLHQKYSLMEKTACVAIFLSDTSNPLPISVDALKDVYGLTQSEAEVAVALANGMTLKDISAAKQRSLETIRSQLKAVLNKTCTKNQADLVRLLLVGTFATIN